ncbi:11532_t:CDS:2, partial [Dentiscutata heterogama]
MRSFLAYTLFLLMTFITFSTADYTVNSPAAGMVYNKSDILPVSWNVTSNTDKIINVTLAHGNSQNFTQDMVLCSNINPNVGQCNYTIGNLTSRRDYVVIVGKDPAHVGYSNYFAINSTGPLPPPSGCPNFGGYDCPESLPCCSASGFCGNTGDYCGTGCDPTHSFNGDSEDYCRDGCDPASSFNGQC